MKMLAEDSPPMQRTESAAAAQTAAAKRASCKEQGTMTMVQEATPAVTQLVEDWWGLILTAGADEARLWQFKRELRMPLTQLLSTVSDIYAKKIVSDEIDDREGNDRHTLSQCMHTFFIRREGGAHAARTACVRVVAAILDALRPAAKTYDPKTESDDEAVSLSAGECVRRRVGLFARFLGVTTDERPALSETAVGIYLAVLLLVQQGAVPLLPLSGDRIMVEVERAVAALDRAFSMSPSVLRERIKTEAAERFGECGQVDLEAVLEYAVEEWVDLHQKRESRLHALFQSLSLGAAIDLTQFEHIFHKAAVDINMMPSYRQSLRMYEEMCLFDRIDGDAFAHVLRRHAFGALDARAIVAQEGLRMTADQEKLLERLEPLYATVMQAVGRGHMLELDKQGRGHGLSFKWAVLEDMLKERRRPELAWVLYMEILQGYSQAARDAKIRDLPTAALPQPAKAAARRRRASNVPPERELEQAQKPALAVQSGSFVHDSSLAGKSNRSEGEGTSTTGSPTVSTAEKRILGTGGDGAKMRRASSDGSNSIPTPENYGGGLQESRPRSSVSSLRSLNSPPVPPPLTSTDSGSRRALDPLEPRSPAARRASELLPSTKLEPPSPSANPSQRSTDRIDTRSASTAAASSSGSKGNEALAGDLGAGCKPARTQTIFRPPSRPEPPARQDTVGRSASATRGDNIAVVAGSEQKSSSEVNLQPLKKSVLRYTSAVQVSEAESVRALATCALFQSVPEGAVRAVFTSSKRRVLRHRQPLFRQGDNGKSMFLSFGEVSLLLHQTWSLFQGNGSKALRAAAVLETVMARTADVICLTPSVLLEITAESLTSLQETFPRLAFNVSSVGNSQLQEAATNGSDEAKKALALLSELRPFMKVSLERTASQQGVVSGRQESEEHGRGLVCAELLHSLILRGNTCAEI